MVELIVSKARASTLARICIPEAAMILVLKSKAAKFLCVFINSASGPINWSLSEALLERDKQVNIDPGAGQLRV